MTRLLCELMKSPATGWLSSRSIFFHYILALTSKTGPTDSKEAPVRNDEGGAMTGVLSSMEQLALECIFHGEHVGPHGQG